MSQILLVHQVQLHPTLPLLLFSSEVIPLMLMGSKWQSWAINISLLVVSHFNPIHIQTPAHHYYETDYETIFILNHNFFSLLLFPFSPPSPGGWRRVRVWASGWWVLSCWPQYRTKKYVCTHKAFYWSWWKRLSFLQALWLTELS